MSEETRPEAGSSKSRDAEKRRLENPEIGVESFPFSRRSLIAAGMGLAATACSKGGGDGDAGKEEPAAAEPFRDTQRDPSRVLGHIGDRGVGAAAADPTYFQDPTEMPMVESAGEKIISLNVGYTNHPIVKRDGEIVSATVRAYNGHVPGPTIRCAAGDKLSVSLKNDLPDDDFTYDYKGCHAKVDDEEKNPAELGLPHGFNTTNLHTHGLHVSPKSLCDGKDCGEPPYEKPPTLASDDVFVEIPPGGSQDYCIVLPDFHAPGTHWYHAHKHGSTALQVNNGLVGALIVEETGADRVLGNQPHEDKILLMQEIMETDGGNDQLVYTRTRGDSSKFFVNGLYQPTIKLKTGEIQRWRFINGTSRPRGLTKLRLVKDTGEPLPDTSDIRLPEEHARNLETAAAEMSRNIESLAPGLLERVRNFERVTSTNAQPMHLIAVDGISLYGKTPRRVTEWNFAPGNRADFLVQVSEPGTYRIVKAAHDYTYDTDGNPTQPAAEVQTLAWVEVSEGSHAMDMPAVVPGTAPCYLQPITSVDADKTVNFQAVSAGSWETVCPAPVPWVCDGNEVTCDGVARPCNESSENAKKLLPRIFAMNCARFDPDVVDAEFQVDLGAVEQWRLNNTTSGGAHPFHIHVNPFQVVEIFNATTGETQTFDPDEALWQDVVALPRFDNNTAGYVKIRQRFLTFPGDFVIHCHFLNHEDLGMMKRVQVRPSGFGGHGPCKPVQKCRLG